MSKPMHEKFGDEYVQEAFEMWLVECGLELQSNFTATREKLFNQFKKAFYHGVTACQNGNIY